MIGREIMPGDLEPRSAIAVAQLAMTVLMASATATGETPGPLQIREAVRLAHDVLDATARELCVRANACRRAEEIARGSVAKGGDS